MAWDTPPMESGSCLDFEEYNAMVTYIKSLDIDTSGYDSILASGNEYSWTYNSMIASGLKWYAAYKHSANASIHANTSGSLHKLWLWSANKSWYANSSNVKTRFKSSSNVWVFASSQNLSGQLLALHRAKDINNWSNTAWHNSGLMWNNNLSKWIPKPSSGTGGGGVSDLSDLNINIDKDWNSKSIYNLISVSSSIISGGIYYTKLDDPVDDRQLANKKYVDDSIAAGGGYTDEMAQDAVGGILTSEFKYVDVTPSISLLGYSTISANALKGALHSSNARYYYYPSSLGKSLMNFSANKSLYANSGNVRYRFKSSSNVWIFASSQKISGQLLALHKARDINDWNSSHWQNSGLVWDSALNKWKASKSGASTGGGVDEFTELTDAPNSYSGKAGKFPIVNESETGLVFADIVIANVSTKTVYESNVTEGPQIVFTTDGVVFA